MKLHDSLRRDLIITAVIIVSVATALGGIVSLSRTCNSYLEGADNVQMDKP